MGSGGGGHLLLHAGTRHRVWLCWLSRCHALSRSGPVPFIGDFLDSCWLWLVDEKKVPGTILKKGGFEVERKVVVYSSSG